MCVYTCLATHVYRCEYMKKYIYRPHSWHNGKESTFQFMRCWRHGLIPGLGRFPGGENSNLLPAWKISWTKEPDSCSPLGCRNQI